MSDQGKYTVVASILHWIVFILVCALFGLGWFMTDLPPGPDRGFYFATHKSIGIEPYRNIEKITLKHFGIPKIKKEHYVILDIPDFFDYLDSTDNKGSHRATTVLYYDTTLGDDTNVGTIKQSHETFEFEFNPKLNALNNLNISIRKHNGEAIKADDFEVVDDVDYAFLYDIHTTFLFEITYVP